MAALNTNYRFLIKPSKYITIPLTFTYASHQVIDPDGIFPFDKLDAVKSDLSLSDTDSEQIPNDNITIGEINFRGNLQTVDLVRNRTTLASLATFYSATGTHDSTITSEIQEYMTEHSFFDTVDLLTIMQQKNASNNNENYTIENLDYFNTLYDQNYSKYIYRAARNKLDLTFNAADIAAGMTEPRLNEIIPVFSLEIPSNYSDIQFYLNIRNFKVQFRKFKIAEHDGLIDFIFVYPEYLLKNDPGFKEVWTIASYITGSMAISSADVSKIKFGYSAIDSNGDLTPDNEFVEYSGGFGNLDYLVDNLTL